MPYRHAQRPPLYEFTFECGCGDSITEFAVTARDEDEALEKACAEAALRGQPDAPLRCVDWCEHDPTGGDGPDD